VEEVDHPTMIREMVVEVIEQWEARVGLGWGWDRRHQAEAQDGEEEYTRLHSLSPMKNTVCER